MPISDSEKIIMDILWQSSSQTNPCSANQIISQLDSSLEWHPKTVKTLLNRLLKKNAIGFTKVGREYFYYPILIQNDYTESVTDSFLKRVYQGSVTSLVSTFAERGKLSERDINELKILVSQLDNKGTDGNE